MRVSAALLLKHLLTRLHPPAPTTASESARLLAVLDHAFRRQLDAAHPPLSSASSSTTQHDQHQHQHQQQQSSILPHPSRPANRHLESLLLHPLLQTKPTAPTHGQPHGTAIDDFDRALRTDTLTVAKLRRIARHYLHQIKHKTLPSSDKLAPKLAAWLEAESVATKLSFFQSADVVHEVVPLMYADGLESTVWIWLRSLYQRDWLSNSNSSRQLSALLHAQDTLVSEMMRMAIKQGSVQDAAAQYVAAAVYRRAQPATPTQIAPPPLTSSYKRISTAILHNRHRHAVDAETFDAILDNAIPFTQENRVVSRDFLRLYHPVSPSAEPLYRELKNDSLIAIWSAWHCKHKLLHAALLLSVLDAAQLSLNQSNSRHARFFLDLAEKHWPDYLSVPGSDSAERADGRIPDETTSSIISRLHRARQLLASNTNKIHTSTGPNLPHLQPALS